jgi:hypothetical protein
MFIYSVANEISLRETFARGLNVLGTQVNPGVFTHSQVRNCRTWAATNIKNSTRSRFDMIGYQRPYRVGSSCSMPEKLIYLWHGQCRSKFLDHKVHVAKRNAAKRRRLTLLVPCLESDFNRRRYIGQ